MVAPRRIVQVEEETPHIAALRKIFESQHVDAHGWSRSRKNVYTNPVVARDWKFFKMGYAAAVEKLEPVQPPKPLIKDEDLPNVRLSSLLVYLRMLRGWNQEDMAKEVKLSHVQISRWEQDHNLPRSSTLAKLAILYGVSYSVLLKAAALSKKEVPTLRVPSKVPVLSQE